MARGKKYRIYIVQFKLPNTKKEALERDTVRGLITCPECRRVLSNRKIRAGNTYCSYKCSNRAKGRLQRGKKRTVLFRAREARKEPSYGL